MSEYTGFKQPPEGVKRRSLEEIRIGVLESQFKQLQDEKDKLNGYMWLYDQALAFIRQQNLEEAFEQFLQGSKAEK